MSLHNTLDIPHNLVPHIPERRWLHWTFSGDNSQVVVAFPRIHEQACLTVSLVLTSPFQADSWTRVGMPCVFLARSSGCGAHYTEQSLALPRQLSPSLRPPRTQSHTLTPLTLNMNIYMQSASSPCDFFHDDEGNLLCVEMMEDKTTHTHTHTTFLISTPLSLCFMLKIVLLAKKK